MWLRGCPYRIHRHPHIAVGSVMRQGKLSRLGDRDEMGRLTIGHGAVERVRQRHGSDQNQRLAEVHAGYQNHAQDHAQHGEKIPRG